MARPDDYSLSESKRTLIRQHALKALQDADALGRFPTPVAAIMNAARVVVSEQPLIDESFLATLRKKSREVGKTLLGALQKVIGVLHVASRIVYLDKTVHIAKRTFLKLHETGHAVLPWQRDIFVLTEDCEKTLAPEIAQEFESEANAFATEVVFQLDAFTEEARQSKLDILIPVRLAKRFGASIYMSVRRYVTTHHRACAVLVLDPPVSCEMRGFVANLRRTVTSPAFQHQFGDLLWPESFTPDDEIGAAVPIGSRRMSRPREITLVDRNGTRHQCLAEAFTQGHQVFVLIHAVATLSRTQVVVP